MSAVLSTDAPALGGLRGILRSWLRTLSGQLRPLSDGLPAEAGRPDAPPSPSVRVLVVDDDPVNLLMMSALLQSRGLVPVLAADGGEAVALACERHFDIILMDLQMPILDGLKATTAIRRFESSCSRPAVPVVAYSSASPGADILAAIGINGSLAKPCDDLDLEACLVRWCPSYRTASTLRAARSTATTGDRTPQTGISTRVAPR